MYRSVIIGNPSTLFQAAVAVLSRHFQPLAFACTGLDGLPSVMIQMALKFQRFSWLDRKINLR